MLDMIYNIGESGDTYGSPVIPKKPGNMLKLAAPYVLTSEDFLYFC
jgi:hypothetical protein